MRTLMFAGPEGSAPLRIKEKLADVGEREPTRVNPAEARDFENWLDTTPLHNDPATAQQYRDRLLEFYARDPEVAMRVASDHHGYVGMSRPDTSLANRGLSGDRQPDAGPDRSDASRAFEHYQFQRANLPEVSTAGDLVLARGDFEAMYKAGFEYDPISATWVRRADLVTRTGRASGTGDPRLTEPVTIEFGTLPSEASAKLVMRMLADGEANALLMIHDFNYLPPGYDSRAYEWGLGKRDDTYVLVRGGSGEINWASVPDVEPISHTHPPYDPATGELRQLTGQDGSGTIDAARLGETAIENDLVYFLPSTGDLRLVASRGERHRVHTPFVHQCGTQIGQPVRDSTASTADSIDIAQHI